MGLPKSVLQTDSIYPLLWNLHWLYFQDSEQHVLFLARFYFYLREKYPILYVLSHKDLLQNNDLLKYNDN